MELTPQEQVVCNVFRRDDGSCRVQYDKCPLVLDADMCICKSNINESEYELLVKERVMDDKNDTFSCH